MVVHICYTTDYLCPDTYMQFFVHLKERVRVGRLFFTNSLIHHPTGLVKEPKFWKNNLQ
jgi:hypothetical protein